MCARIHWPSPNILLLQTSRFQSWPFVEEIDAPVTCSEYFFHDGGNGSDAATNRLYISVSDQTATESVRGTQRCDPSLILPEFANAATEHQDLRIDFDGGIHSRGSFETDVVLTVQHYGKAVPRWEAPTGDPSSSRKLEDYDDPTNGFQAAGFKLILIDYPMYGHQSEQSYTCIDSIGFGNQRRHETTPLWSPTSSAHDERYLVTESGDDREVLCWWFPRNFTATDLLEIVEEQFYLLPGIACYDSFGVESTPSSTVERDRHQGRVLATFTRLVQLQPSISPLAELVDFQYHLGDSSLPQDHSESENTEIDGVSFNAGSVPVVNSLVRTIIAMLFILCSHCS